MRSFTWLLCLGFAMPVQAQYYLRGEIRDDLGNMLQGVKITLDSKGSAPYYSGAAGTFGIPLQQQADSITLSLEGFETLRDKADTRQYQSFTLKRLATTEYMHPGKRSSFTTNLPVNYVFNPSMMGESYHSLVENPFIETDHYPETGFAISVDKASYSNVRRFLNNEMLVPPDAVRIEEMLNYFDFSRDFPRKRTQFLFRTQFTSCPWNSANNLLFIRVAAPMLQLDSLPPSNLVFLIDISGSMDRPNRLPLLQSAFKLLVDNLRPVDTITIVTYGGGVGVALPPTSGDRKQFISNVIDSLTASGDTPGENAIRIAYELAKRSFQPKGNNRVILATDGDFNVGESSEKELENLITSYRETGIYLTCLGVGMGNYKDSKLETLAKKGNGNFAYLDNLEEAQKVLVREFTQTLYAVADNTYLRIRFYPGIFSAYRLIGFDNVSRDAEDSAAQLEGGEVGSGHTMMAMFEVATKPGDSAWLQKPVADINLVFQRKGSGNAIKQSFPVVFNHLSISQADSCYRLAASVAAFGSLLRKSAYLPNYRWEEVYRLAASACQINSPAEAGFLLLIEKAMKLYDLPAKRKRKK